MRYSELEKLLIKKGCLVYREGSGHTIWINKETGKKFPISRHKTQEVPKGTLKSIMRDAGLE
jgi:mRNA interferase HicA